MMMRSAAVLGLVVLALVIGLTFAAQPAGNGGDQGGGAAAAQSGNNQEKETAVSGSRTTEAAPPPVYSASGYDVTPLSEERVQELAAPLTEAQRRVILSKGTEAAFCGTLLDNHKEGTYVCALCGLPLFSSEAKFHSGTGWPSFFQPVDKAHVRELRDTSHGMVRTEIECARCGGHLGHVFEDGPPPTGLRYCMNSESLEFFEKGTQMPERSQPVKTETAYFAGGCFWGTEDRFAQVPGVVDVVSGYQGGSVEAPTYKQVCTGTTGHAETVRVTFDPARVSYHDLLEYFFVFHNPTQLNRQGPDVGTQYRSAIFAADEKQFKEAAAFVEEQRASERFQGKKIVTQVERAKPFYEAEAYHQDYHVKHGGSCPIPALD